jgi:hypothetical protein
MDLQEVSMPAGFRNKTVKPDLSRPKVDLDRTGVTREWRDVEVQDLVQGDTVAGMGVVVSTTPTCRGEIVLEVGLPATKTHFINESDILKAFVKKGS